MKKWMLKRNHVDIKRMAERLNIDETTACILANRGIGTYKQALNFLEPDISNMYDTYSIKDMEKGINIICEKINQRKKIAIYGDYDVDGVMSITILYKVLKESGADVIYYVPNRQTEGYGLNTAAIDKLYEMKVDTIFTCDNGIVAFDEVKKAKDYNMTVVILDHHEPSFEIDNSGEKKYIIPCADAVIDIKQVNCEYPFKFLCAAGLAYKFASALVSKLKLNKNLLNEYLNLAAIATVCDIVDLVDENRTIVKNGLKNIKETTNIGLLSLIKKTDLYFKNITEYHIGFIIGPCINATGRLESAEISIKLFIESDDKKADEFALKLIKLNNERKVKTEKATDYAINQVLNTNIINDKVLVIYDENIHESVAGIVAGRVKERFYRPTIIITKSEKLAKGSARSIEAYNIFEELFKCKDLFERFGGHAMAAGISLEYENIDILRQKLNDFCTLTEDEMIPVLKIERQLNIEDITMSLAKELENLAPFGKANDIPMFGSKHIYLEKINLIGKDKNIIRFYFISDNQRISGTLFDGYEKFKNLIKNLHGEDKCDKIMKGYIADIYLDIVYTININSYNGQDNLQLIIKDFRGS